VIRTAGFSVRRASPSRAPRFDPWSVFHAKRTSVRLPIEGSRIARRVISHHWLRNFPEASTYEAGELQFRHKEVS